MRAETGSVRIVEVGPRDGLQNISTNVPTAIKVELIRRLVDVGLTTVEATSCVSPTWVPQMADNQQVLSSIQHLLRRRDLSMPVLVPNIKGLDAAVAGGAREVAVFVSASEGFSKKNTNCTIAEALDRISMVMQKASNLGIRVRGYVSCISHCPYDGRVSPEAVLRVAQALIAMGCYEVSLGDTTGMATVAEVEKLLGLLLRHIPASQLAGHFHDTYGQAVANALKSYELGLRSFDSSVAGLGGCPYAKGAKGNVATEDLVYAFQGLGVRTNVDLDRLSAVGAWISDQLAIPYGSRAGMAIQANISTSTTKTPQQATRPTEEWKPVKKTGELSISRFGPNVKYTLMRPKQGNTLTTTMVADLTESLLLLAKDRSVFRIIITGSGKFFCTGMDLSSQGATTSSDSASKDAQFSSLVRLFEAISAAPQVTISCINGSCFGGGVGLALACDIRVAVKSAEFTLSEAKLGLAPAVISPYVVRELGYSRARYAMLSAKSLTASGLHQLGVIHEIADGPQSLDLALSNTLHRLSLCAPRASSLCKELVDIRWKQTNEGELGQRVKDTFFEMMGSPEAKYGIAEFRKKTKKVDWEMFYASQDPGSKRAKL